MISPPWAYPAAMLCALATGCALSRGSQRGLGLGKRERLGLLLGAFCGAMFGSKVLSWLAGAAASLPASSMLDGGKTILGGLAGGYLGVELAKESMGISIKTGDSFAVPVAASVAVGRLACFVGRCCYGTSTSLPWAVDFGDGTRRHPTQIYEFLFHSAAAALLWRLRRDGLFKHQLIKLYILAYLAYRFATEFIRPEPRLVGALTAYQLAALALAPVFAGLWLLDRRAAAAARA